MLINFSIILYCLFGQKELLNLYRYLSEFCKNIQGVLFIITKYIFYCRYNRKGQKAENILVNKSEHHKRLMNGFAETVLTHFFLQINTIASINQSGTIQVRWRNIEKVSILKPGFALFQYVPDRRVYILCEYADINILTSNPLD